MLFDANEEFDKNVKELLSQFPPKIYLIMYSKLETLSGLHVALLGHEIGHIFAIEWISKEFPRVAGNVGLMVRLKHNVIPNAMNKNGQDYPIDIRNILYSIWLFCYNNDDKDLKNYADQIQFYNLLGVKGIELSVEQGNYTDFVAGSNT
jgi:hypothetical protein